MQGSTNGDVIRFDVFEADLRTQELRKHGLRIKLPRQSFQILQMLAEHPGELVSRDQLQTSLWSKDTFVDFDQGLNKAVNRLREALQDSPEKPRYIETLPRLGYRFVGTLIGGSANAPSAAPPVESTAAEARFGPAGAVVAIGAMLLAGLLTRLWLTSFSWKALGDEDSGS